jgi:hypothetical protein
MTFLFWLNRLLCDAAATDRTDTLAHFGDGGLRSLYDSGVEPSIDAVVNYSEHIAASSSERQRQLCQELQVEEDGLRILQLSEELTRLSEKKDRWERKSSNDAA